ncbi:MAG: hypothetical protein AUJ31_00090 [Parcubacteria group bacterium CG1_02_39_15]|uniref:DUF763 domain-containing protein n=2 Tax=Candidatus Nealsoniibacteriota TaxID=1817911 RepID=A0A2M7IKS5_9BACT|nr:MAG: hypothetical protein AUJ31_00090 [Parcubacteria group bacterium CG1_02_39_15]PIW90608.1 MAG: DUF763 domain-containing protein [Candidatus Nealsonbacteria bacterium CG_4_8_14_3_um_filter_40_11]
MRTGVAQLPLDTGKCPYWLFERMKRLLKAITIAIIEEFGSEEFIRRLSDPVWFQSLSAASAMDWNSSGTTTITMGALKEALRDLQSDLGIFICGGKKVSRKTPEEIEKYSEVLGLTQEKSNKLIYASKMAAKVDSSLIQNLQVPFQLYHHNFIFTKNGHWTVIQQAMAPAIQKARRYHWLSSNVNEFVEEPHSGIIADVKLKPLNLVARESRENKEISTELVKEEPKTFLKDIKLISEKSNALIRQKRFPGFAEMELNDVEFHWHPVLKEKFDLKRLGKTIFFAKEQNPENFEKLLSLKGVGPKTIRALSLVAEVIYGAKPSYEDPARYSFTVGGKDHVPYSIDLPTYSNIITILEKAIKRAKIENRERVSAIKRLYSSINYE